MPINLKVLLPFQIFVEKKAVKRIVAQSLQGSFGLLPHRLDCAAALAPGILTYETEAEGEVYLAVDQGVLVKAGRPLSVAAQELLTWILERMTVFAQRAGASRAARTWSARR